MTYTQVTAGGNVTVLLRSDGTAIACGDNGAGQCDLPALEAGMTYTQASTDGGTVLLLRSDGRAITCGCNDFGQGDIPVLPDDVMYTQVSASLSHSVFLRNDGTAIACGTNRHGQCRIPALPATLSYWQPDFVVQLSIDAAGRAICRDFGGESIASWSVGDRRALVQPSVAKMVVARRSALAGRRLRVVLSDGRLVGRQHIWLDVGIV